MRGRGHAVCGALGTEQCARSGGRHIARYRGHDPGACRGAGCRVADASFPRSSSGAPNSGLAVLAQVSLGTRERAVLLRVGDRQLLVGVAPGNVRTLHVVDAVPPARHSMRRRTIPDAPTATLSSNRCCSRVWANEHAGNAVRWSLQRAAADGVAVGSRSAACAPGIPALAVQSSGGGQTYTLTIQLLALMTAITLLPAALLMMTAFTRIIIVLSILRQAIGAGQSPPNQVLIGLALFLTLFVMSPVIDKIRTDAVMPYMAGTIDTTTALERGVAPLKTFMLEQTRESDIAAFVRISGGKGFATPQDVPLTHAGAGVCDQ